MNRGIRKIVLPMVILVTICGAIGGMLVESVSGQGGRLSARISQLALGTGPSVEVWKRFEVTLPDPTWEGNPFDVALTGVFVHTSTGRSLTQLGFYAGNDVWKIHFMPDQPGEWTYVTQSTDPDLNGVSGSFNAVASNLPGKLYGEGNRWRLSGSGETVAPIMLPTRQWFKRTPTSNGVDDFITWSDDTAGALIIGTTLVYFTHAQDEVPYLKGQEGEYFNIPMWDRLNSHYDYLRDRGMGFYIMFYSDDQEAPNRWGIAAQSPAEMRLFRYAVARFSAYPIVMWDTGIDIGETRPSAWIDWFADWFNANDPWRHPVSSRTGGGSGGKFPANGSYFSDGAATLPDHATVVSSWSSRNVPTAYTDRWREDYGRGNFNTDKIRRAAWEVGLVGGTAIYVSGNENGGYLTENYASDFNAAPYLGYRDRFFRERILDFAELTPHSERLVSGSGIVISANLGQEYVVYDSDGGEFTLDLSDMTGGVYREWFNPRNGEYYDQSVITVEPVQSFSPPFTGESVLHLIHVSAEPTPTEVQMATPTSTIAPTPPNTLTPAVTPLPTEVPSSTPTALPTSIPTDAPSPSRTPVGPPSATVEPSPPPAPTPSPFPSPASDRPTVHVSDIDLHVRASRGGAWKARVSVEIRDADETLMKNALVEASWSGALTGTTSCVTNGKGICRISSRRMSGSASVLALTVDRVILASYTYQPEDNDDPDDDSDGTTIVFYQE